MIGRHATQRAAIAVGLSVLLCGSTVRAQDELSRAKDFYASAAYEEALAVLESLHDKGSATESTEISAYQMLCLVALGRSDEAKLAIEAIVRSDPMYHVSEAQASPRVRALFETVRKPLLPAIVRDSYAKGRQAFDRKEMAAALKEFDRMIALVDEIGGEQEGLKDLRTLASGFRDLSKMALAATGTGASAPGPVNVTPPTSPASGTPAPMPAGSVTSAPSAGKPAGSGTRGAPSGSDVAGPDDPDVKRPVAISQVYPPWHPQTAIEQKLEFNGYLDLLIGEDGTVLSVGLLKSVHPRYDALLLDAARKWTFRPATRNGRPVKYRYTVGVHLAYR